MAQGGIPLRLEIPRRLLIAVGGNAIHPSGIAGTPEEQVAIVAATARALLPVMQLENELVVTHGNGPVVGKILLRQSLARHRVAPMSLDICVAHSQGWSMQEDAGRGFRLVVPSPEPKHVVDISLFDALARRGAVVIAGGGGGIPVIQGPKKVRHGVEAVIDKDLTSAHMASVLGMEVMMILTGVSRVAIHFRTPRQRELGRITLSEARRYLREGHFPEGSMGPKVEAALRFVERGGKRAVIGHLIEALPALTGERDWHPHRSG